MDIKRVAFETRAVKSARPAVGIQTAAITQPIAGGQPTIAGGKINRQEIAAIVDRFLAGKNVDSSASPSPLPKPPVAAEAGSMYVEPVAQSSGPVNNGGERSVAPPQTNPASSSNGKKAVDFVSEDDVRRAIQKGEKIYVSAKTIITPSARDIGDPAEVFAKI